MHPRSYLSVHYLIYTIKPEEGLHDFHPLAEHNHRIIYNCICGGVMAEEANCCMHLWSVVKSQIKGKVKAFVL